MSIDQRFANTITRREDFKDVEGMAVHRSCKAESLPCFQAQFIWRGMVRLAGIEPATSGSTNLRSNQLSYNRTFGRRIGATGGHIRGLRPQCKCLEKFCEKSLTIQALFLSFRSVSAAKNHGTGGPLELRGHCKNKRTTARSHHAASGFANPPALTVFADYRTELWT